MKIIKQKDWSKRLEIIQNIPAQPPEWIGKEARCKKCGTEVRFTKNDKPEEVKYTSDSGHSAYWYQFICPECSGKIEVLKTVDCNCHRFKYKHHHNDGTTEIYYTESSLPYPNGGFDKLKEWVFSGEEQGYIRKTQIKTRKKAIIGYNRES